MKLILVSNDEVLDTTEVERDEWDLAQKGRPTHAQAILNRLLAGKDAQ